MEAHLPERVKYIQNLLFCGKAQPKAPKVTPKSGDYNKKTEIKITVPDGCKAYYAFDSEPDLNSTVYEQPISMPVGYHRLNVILVAANGKTSKMTAMEYYLQY